MFDQGIVECLPTAACLCDRSGQVVIWNQASVRLWGGTPEKDGDGRYRSAHKLFRPDGTDLVWPNTPVAEVMETGTALSDAEVLLERSGGTRARCRLNIAPLCTGQGRIVGAIVCFQTLDGPGDQPDQEVLAALPAALEERTHEIAETIADPGASELRFRLLMNGARDYAICMLYPDGRVADWNSGAERLNGYIESEIVGRHFSILYSDDDRDWGAPQRALATARAVGRVEAEGWRRRKDGSRFWVNAVIDPIRDETGQLIGYAMITRDLTEKREIEDQLRQAQKTETIGQLTGGVAHDFNNLLAVVVGNLEALKRRFDGSHGTQEALFQRLTDGALCGADRAASLTRQLLTFSRLQAPDPQPVEPAVLIAGTLELLKRSLGERIIIEASVPTDVWTVFADAQQMESALLNLAVNARDTMPTGGRLIISAANIQVGAAAAARKDDLLPGDYVVISVADTGTGMSTPVATKAFGRGSGLGLSQVYGFAKQSGGLAVIDSASGMGTVVRLHLPRFHGAIGPAAVNPTTAPVQTDTHILLVEDDDLVRSCSLEMLRDLGYQAITARDGHEALQLLESHPEINLVFTDLGLPGGLDGEQLATQIRRQRPEMKFLFTTGYVEAGKRPQNDAAGHTAILGKPFDFARLGEQLRFLLDG
jgi:PAS domain S-box-containing protein